MEQIERMDAEILIKKVLKEKSFRILTEEEKTFLFDVYSFDMKVACKDYEKYLLLSESEKLANILVLVLKEYMGSWHVTSEEMKEISEYIQTISKIE